MTPAPGTRLGPYEILAPLGAGGMGEVYRARDTKLDREVAVKVLPEKLAADRDALERFEREAKAVAALSHPNILGIYDLGREGDASYAVMELLVGQTLWERLAEGPLPQRKALEIALAIAQGLAAAHEKGIVHRDVKPENIFLTVDGRVKILDFGLAKVAGPQADGTKSPTVASTEPGTIMGTVGYMSPEQVRGKPADARSDIFSLGCVLYEMLTGDRAFQGESPAEAMAAIAQLDPEELAAPTGRFPSAVEKILRHCLEKRPEERFDTAHDLAFALETAIGAPSAARVEDAPARTAGRWKRALVPLAILAALAAGIFAGARLFAPGEPRLRQITYHRGFIYSARFAPDGQTIVYGSTRRDDPLRVYSTRRDSIESRDLGFPPGDIVGMSRGGEMALLLDRKRHGTWISRGTLAAAELGGGAPREILENVNDADISPDGKQFAAVREQGSRQRLEFPLGRTIFETSGWVSHPRISPDGRRLAFLEHPAYGNNLGYVALADADGRVARVSALFDGLDGLAWAPGGREIWFSGSRGSSENFRLLSIWAIRPGGRARLVYSPPVGLLIRDVAADGAVLADAIDTRSEIAGRLAGDAAERNLSTWGDEAVRGISDDGTVFAGIEQSAAGTGADPYMYFRRADDPAPVRLGVGTAWGMTPDGKWVLSGSATGKPTQFLLSPTGPGQARAVDLGRIELDFSSQRMPGFSADGRLLSVVGREPGRLSRLWLVDLSAPAAAARPLTREGVAGGLLSPDGKTVAAVVAPGSIERCPASGGACAPIPGVLPGEIPQRWDPSGRAILVWDQTWPARTYLVDVGTGQRRLWKEVVPPDVSSVLYGNLYLSRDGAAYVYRVRRIDSHLFVIEGLK
jgi:Tol biopolymer transport system component